MKTDFHYILSRARFNTKTPIFAADYTFNPPLVNLLVTLACVQRPHKLVTPVSLAYLRGGIKSTH